MKVYYDKDADLDVIKNLKINNVPKSKNTVVKNFFILKDTSIKLNS